MYITLPFMSKLWCHNAAKESTCDLWTWASESQRAKAAGFNQQKTVWSTSMMFPRWKLLNWKTLHNPWNWWDLSGGSVVECRTPEREVRGSRPTAAVLCPWVRHFTPRKYWLITQEAMALSRHDWKIVDWDVKPQHNQPTFSFRYSCIWFGKGKQK